MDLVTAFRIAFVVGIVAYPRFCTCSSSEERPEATGIGRETGTKNVGIDNTGARSTARATGLA